MVCVPTPLSVAPVSTAAPALRVTGLPLFNDTDVDPIKSENVTAPVGMVELWPVVVSVTVAVTVSGWPMLALAGLVETATAVVSPGWCPRR